MARFDRYMLSQLMVLFGFFALVLILVYWINRAVVLFDQLIADGQSAWVFLELTALSLPGVIRIVLPIAAIAASIYVTNRLSSESELTVVQATGYSPFRLSRAPLVFGLIVTLLMSALVHVLGPMSSAEFNKRNQEISQNVIARLLTEGQFLSPVDGVTFYIRDITPNDELLDIFLSDTRNPRESLTYTAKRAFILNAGNGPQLVMIEGMAQALLNDAQRLLTTRFDDFAYDISDFIPALDQGDRSIGSYTSLALLSPNDALMASTGLSKPQIVAALHSRIAESLLAVVAALLGFSTLVSGTFSRFGVWRQVVLAVLLVIAIKMVDTAAANAVRTNPAIWMVYYSPIAAGFVIVWFQLFWSSRPMLFRLRRRPALTTESGVRA